MIILWCSPVGERREKQKFERQMPRLTWGMLWVFALFWVSRVWLLSLFLDCIPAKLMDISCIWGNRSQSCCFALHHVPAASSRALQSWVIGVLWDLPLLGKWWVQPQLCHCCLALGECICGVWKPIRIVKRWRSNPKEAGSNPGTEIRPL